jgi:NADPH-dependent 2,4-dienoyl-CoA reductase/sulfur reductase-like enzyme
MSDRRQSRNPVHTLPPNGRPDVSTEEDQTMSFDDELEAGPSEQSVNKPCPSETSMPEPPQVVVVGAGFAGLAAVRALRGTGAAITLVDARSYSTFQPLLYQVATSGLNPGDVTYSNRRFARRHGASFRLGLVTDIGDSHVLLDDGRQLRFDYLVLAAGVTANFSASVARGSTAWPCTPGLRP